MKKLLFLLVLAAIGFAITKFMTVESPHTH